MAIYKYRALTASGDQAKGTLTAANKAAAKSMLLNQGLIILSLTLVKTPLFTRFVFRKNHQSTAELFVKKLAMFLSVSLPLKESLQAILQHESAVQQQSIYRDIYQKVCAGQPLSSAFAAYPDRFDSMLCSACAAGERSGQLPLALQLYSLYQDKRRRLNNTLRQGLTYPLFLLVTSVIIIGFLLGVAVPTIVEQLSLSGGALPLTTRWLMALGSFLASYGQWLILGIICAVASGYALCRHANWRFRYHKALLHLPKAGALLRQIQSVRVLMTLSILMRTAVPLNDSMVICTAAVSNLFLRKRMLKSSKQLAEGATLHATLRDTDLLDATSLELIDAGEHSGRLPEMVEYTAELISTQLEQRLKLYIKLIEPVMIFTIGSIVLLVFMAVIQPMLSLNNIAIS
ncbi:type II secretion system F family protein [Serratia quinivorans]|uniref:type II secretion system F family protein n=1 Tax=Serratia quinivorans TaxID=137545 RepID=UPI002177A222|nr:type II secretion system F family protein [Serratia quinivorans]CAI1114166.1 type IV pilin biogenesis protein [Serratia quinivorans]CAI1875781.1 type IV pilin biogenesis protein [Serratia quinivorans]